MFDPQGVQEFVMFDVVDPSNEVSLIEFVKRPKNKADKIDQLKVTDSPIRQARVAQLARLYATETYQGEISPFDDETGSIETFLKEYN